MANKYPWNTDELINEEELDFPDKNKERSRVRYKRGLAKAKKRKDVADRSGIEVRGGLHRFMDSKIGDILQPNNQRKRRAYMKKYNPSLDEQRLEEATKGILDEDYADEVEELVFYDPDLELLY